MSLSNPAPLERFSNSRLTRLSLLLLIFTVILVYIKCLKAGFVYDDNGVVVGNPVLNRPDLWEILSRPETVGTGIRRQQVFRPLQTLMFALEHALWGVNPVGFHGVNIMLHVVNALLAFFVLRPWVRIPEAALAGAAVFALHPVQTEVVAWVTSRSSLLYLLFVFLAVLAWRRWRSSEDLSRWGWSGLTALLFVLALSSKEMAASFPLLILLVDWLETGKGFVALIRRWWLRYGVLIVVLLGYMVWRQAVVGRLGYGQWPGGPGLRAMVMAKAMLAYVKVTLFPTALTVMDRLAKSAGFVEPELWAAIGLLAASGAVILWGRAHRHFRFALGWFFVSLLPVSNIVPLTAVMAERFLYGSLLSVGVFLALAVDGLGNLSTTRRAIGSLCVALVLTLFAARTVARTHDWMNNHALFRSAVVAYPENVLARSFFTSTLIDKGRWEEVENQLLILGSSNHPQALAVLGRASFLRGQLEQANKYYQRAVQLTSGDPEFILGLASVAAQKRRLDEAKRLYKQVIDKDPLSSGAWVGLGTIYQDSGQLGEAYQAYTRALEINSADQAAMNNLGIVLFRTKDVEGAIKAWKEVLELNPDNVDSLYNLANAYQARGNAAQTEALLSRLLPLLSPESELAKAVRKRLEALEETRSP